jgi:hypothetical protein
MLETGYRKVFFAYTPPMTYFDVADSWHEPLVYTDDVAEHFDETYTQSSLFSNNKLHKSEIDKMQKEPLTEVSMSSLENLVLSRWGFHSQNNLWVRYKVTVGEIAFLAARNEKAVHYSSYRVDERLPEWLNVLNREGLCDGTYDRLAWSMLGLDIGISKVWDCIELVQVIHEHGYSFDDVVFLMSRGITKAEWLLAGIENNLDIELLRSLASGCAL